MFKITDRFLVGNVNQGQQALLPPDSQQESFSFLKLTLWLLLSKEADKGGGRGKKGAGGKHLGVKSLYRLV